MLRFKNFIVEGGNITVKTVNGDAKAAPFAVKNRSSQVHDIHHALSALHDSFHKEHGHHLFGDGKKALKSGSLYAGSTKHLMNKGISDEDFAKHKKTVGDVDVQIPHEHGEKLHAYLKAGATFGKYKVLGTKKHGNEVSAVMRHSESGEHHQFDFEKSHYKNNEPTAGEQFMHSSSWHDTQAGIKGMHHKILINAAAGDTHKFSITHGLRSRTDEKEPAKTEPHHVAKHLFGNSAEHKHIHSFLGVTALIAHHIPAAKHQAIYDKFKSGVTNKGDDKDHAKALAHLKKHLHVQDNVHESTTAKGEHASMIPMVGFSPISHMGHAHDLGGALKKLPGHKHIGISQKADLFQPEERKKILHKQWGSSDDHHVHIVNSAGVTSRHAFDSMKGNGGKHLHILVGHDRKDMANNLKHALENGKIKEMEHHKFDSITIHHPEDTDRSHGMSGTNMRKAAADKDHAEFHRHLGPMFSKKESEGVMNKIHHGLKSGALKVKR